MALEYTYFLAFLFLLGSGALTAFNGAIRLLHHRDHNYKIEVKSFFYHKIHDFFFPTHHYEGYLCATIVGQNICKFTFILFGFASSLYYEMSPLTLTIHGIELVLVGFIIGDYLPRLAAARYPEESLKGSAFISSIFLTPLFPLTYIVITLSQGTFRSLSFEKPITKIKKELFDIIHKASITPGMTQHETKLLESVLEFKDRIAREVMVPRVDLFSLSADTPIRVAIDLIQQEGYSRIPVYRNTVDNIVGVLMYKDVLNKFMEYVDKDNDASILDAPIETIQKNVLYTPETSKISNLLLEFRKKQVHLAIVVDEYGGTEGIVTIEDILEEIVGEIEDEYDEEEEVFFAKHDDAWIVDARMSIHDVEEELDVKIPQEGEYDTLGGYVFHSAGSIPSKGFVIHEKEFELEVLRSDERRVHRVKIKPLNNIKGNKGDFDSKTTGDQKES